MGKLFVYGTLCPGKSNEQILNNIGGTWQKGYVLGKLYEEGWGAALGSPGIRFEEKEDKIEGYLFTSEKLETHWHQLDEFEGEAYQRIKTTVFLDDKTVTKAFIYALK